MQEEIEKLKMSRIKVQELTDKLNEVKLKFEEENKSTIEELKFAKTELSETEQLIKIAVLDKYISTSEKHYDGGISIRINTRQDYSDEDAMTWAMANRRCLMLDTTKFKKVIETFDLPFVNIVKIPTVCIPSKLE